MEIKFTSKMHSPKSPKIELVFVHGTPMEAVKEIYNKIRCLLNEPAPITEKEIGNGKIKKPKFIHEIEKNKRPECFGLRVTTPQCDTCKQGEDCYQAARGV